MIRQHILRTVVIGVIGLIIGLIVAFTSPKVYEGRTQLVVGSHEDQNQTSQVSADVQKILAAGGVSSSATETEILRGRSLFYEALSGVATKTNNPALVADFEHYYKMYEVLGDEKSSAVLILARMHDPKLAQMLANEIADVYNAVRRRTTVQSLDTAKRYLENQAQSAKSEVDEAQRVLRVYKEKVGVADYEQAAGQLASAKTLAQQKLDEANAELSSSEAELGQLKSQMATIPKRTTNHVVGHSTAVQNLQGQLSSLQVQRAQLESKYEPDSTEVTQIRAEMATVQRDLKEALKNDDRELNSTSQDDPTYMQVHSQVISATARHDGLVRQIASYNSTISASEKRLQDLAPVEQKLAELRRDLGIKEQAYVSLSSQLNLIRNRAQVQPDPGQVLYSAVEDPDPIAPDHAKYAFIGLFAGFVVGMLYSFFLEASRMRVYTSHQLAEITGIPVSGTIRAIPPRVANRLMQSLHSPSGELLESVRFMAYAATADPASMSKRVMFVSGTNSDAGATLAVSQFALAAARTGLKVLLVDANLQSPEITRAFGLQGKPGLSNILTRDMLPSADVSLLSPTEHENLFVLPSGTGSLNSVKEAWSAHLSGILGSLAFQVDMIVISAPNCMQVADASRLAPYIDEAFIVISARSANARSVSSAYEIMVRSGAPKVSLIMTDASPSEEAFARQAGVLLKQA